MCRCRTSRDSPAPGGTGIARKESHGNPASLRLGTKLLHTIGPVGAAAEEPDDDEPRAGDRAGDVLVDRERMAEAEVIGNADFGHIAFGLPAGHRGGQPVSYTHLTLPTTVFV